MRCYRALAVGLVVLWLAGCDRQPATNASAAKKSGPVSGAPEPIKLTAGVALPQTLPAPSGQSSTVIMCSVDYRWTRQAEQPNGSYVWRIAWSGGRHVDIPADLGKPQGTLQTILRDVRPEEGPFNGQILAPSPHPGEPLPISNPITMR